MVPTKKDLKQVASSSAKGAESYFFWVFNVVGSIFTGVFFLILAFLPSTYENATSPILAILGIAMVGLLSIWWGVRNLRGWKNRRKCWPYDWRNR
jgi:formate hydrogenlyase subunit 3/multisubunit Na+/H+ antiporter MnhD subunit